VRFVSSRNFAAIGLLAVLTLYGVRTLWVVTGETIGIDFYQLRAGGKMVRDTDDFYSPATRARMGTHYLRQAMQTGNQREITVAQMCRDLRVFGTPLLYSAASLMGGTYEQDLFRFRALMFISLITAICILAIALRMGLVTTLAFLAALFTTFGATISDAIVVNTNPAMLLVLSIATFFVTRRRFGAAGVLLALATVVKPNILPVLPLLGAFLLVQKRLPELRNLILGAAGGTIAGLVAGFIPFGTPAIWLDWLKAFRALPDDYVPVQEGNIALARMVKELAGVNIAIPLMIALFAITVAIAWKSRSRLRTDLAAIGLGCAVFELGSPLVWMHYLLLIMPLFAYLFRGASDDESERDVRVRQNAGALAFFILALNPWGGTPDIGVMRVATAVNFGLLILFVAALRDLAIAQPESTHLIA
jgi:glycosyl transferase family 87